MGSVLPPGVTSLQSQHFSPLPQTQSSQFHGRTVTDLTQSRRLDGAPGEACEATSRLSINLTRPTEEADAPGTDTTPLAERRITVETSVAPPEDASLLLELPEDPDADEPTSAATDVAQIVTGNVESPIVQAKSSHFLQKSERLIENYSAALAKGLPAEELEQALEQSSQSLAEDAPSIRAYLKESIRNPHNTSIEIHNEDQNTCVHIARCNGEISFFMCPNSDSSHLSEIATMLIKKGEIKDQAAFDCVPIKLGKECGKLLDRFDKALDSFTILFEKLLEKHNIKLQKDKKETKQAPSLLLQTSLSKETSPAVDQLKESLRSFSSLKQETLSKQREEKRIIQEKIKTDDSRREEIKKIEEKSAILKQIWKKEDAKKEILRGDIHHSEERRWEL